MSCSVLNKTLSHNETRKTIALTYPNPTAIYLFEWRVQVLQPGTFCQQTPWLHFKLFQISRNAWIHGAGTLETCGRRNIRNPRNQSNAYNLVPDTAWNFQYVGAWNGASVAMGVWRAIQKRLSQQRMGGKNARSWFDSFRYRKTWRQGNRPKNDALHWGRGTVRTCIQKNAATVHLTFHVAGRRIDEKTSRRNRNFRHWRRWRKPQTCQITQIASTKPQKDKVLLSRLSGKRVGAAFSAYQVRRMRWIVWRNWMKQPAERNLLFGFS